MLRLLPSSLFQGAARPFAVPLARSFCSMQKPPSKDAPRPSQTTTWQDRMAADQASLKPSKELLSDLLENNKRWAARMEKINPEFFSTLAKQQTPKILWIGCSDSRVPANQIIDLAPGEVFVHRNIANVFTHTDLNALSVLQYAVDYLKVRHVIVCGHYGCGGVAASTENKQFGLIDNWLRNLKDVYAVHRKKLEAVAAQPNGKQKMIDLLCELNVARSLHNVCHTSVVQNAWARGQELCIHGWCYRLDDGLIRDLKLRVSSVDEIESTVFRVIDSKMQAEA